MNCTRCGHESAGEMSRCPGVTRLALFVLLSLLVAGNAAALYAVLTSRYPLMIFDFHPLWEAARELFLRGGDPYSDVVTLLIERAKGGPEVTAAGSDHTFAYPLPTLFLLLPVAWLPLPWAQAVWYTMLEVALVTGVVLGARGMGWRPPAWLLACAAVWAFLVLPNTWALILGQVALLVFACIAGASWALSVGRDGLAGALLACATVKPQMSLLLLPALAAWAVARRRWGVLKGLGGTLVFLYGISFLLERGWVVGFLYALSRYAGHSDFVSPVALVARAAWPARASLLTAALTCALLTGLVGAWCWVLRRQQGMRWGIGVTLVVTLLIMPRTSIVNHGVLILPLFLALTGLPGPARRRHLLVAGVFLLILVMVWGLDLLVLAEMEAGRAIAQHRTLGLMIPLAMGIVLLVGRGRMMERCGGE
jgi:hypothetical protein